MRRTPLKSSRGTVIPQDMRRRVYLRDRYICVGEQLRWPSHHDATSYQLELDHVRASHGMGMKSETTDPNLVTLCFDCHSWKTNNGREARPQLLRYLESFEEAVA